MKKQATTRDYNFSDADLYMLCSEKIVLAERDLRELEQYNFDKVRLSAFRRTCVMFREIASDDELLGEQMLYTERKNVAREKLKTAIRSLMLRVSQQFDEKGGRYRKFGTFKMADMSDPQLLLCGRRVVRVAAQQLDNLAETGLRQKHLDEVAESTGAFENSIHIQQDKIADRDIAVERRIELGNWLYKELVTLCDMGKDIWAESNHVKYEAYVLYESNADQKRLLREKKKKEQEALQPENEQTD